MRHAGLADAPVSVRSKRSAHWTRQTPWSGFTLLELIIVVLVISILLGLAIPSYQRYLQRD